MARKTLAEAAANEVSAKQQPPHVIVEARAGTGKSTTILEGVVDIYGMPHSITPSAQQQAIWEMMQQSAGANSIHLVAFNRAIADHLGAKIKQIGLPPNVTASGMHQMGLKIISKNFGFVNLDKYRLTSTIAHVCEIDSDTLRNRYPDLLSATTELTKMCKLNLVDGTDEAELLDLADHYDIDLGKYTNRVLQLVPDVLELSKLVLPERRIDYDDMIWLPVVLDLRAPRYDMMLVDEAQDLNLVQQELTFKCGSRLFYVGDTYQSIYGWAGADTEAMSRLHSKLSATPRGCKTLPLTVSRRCGKAIAVEARKIVPDFEAHESNSDGIVRKLKFRGAAPIPAFANSDGSLPGANLNVSYHAEVQDGDMILCRCNAPLISECLKFIAAGRKAYIQGRKDVSVGLVKLLDKSGCHEVVKLIGWLDGWLEREQAKESAKKRPSESRLMALQDKYDCLMALSEDADKVSDVIAKIQKVFTDDPTVVGIMLSSIHKAKGLEAKRVFFLVIKEAPIPHPMAKTKSAKEQETHLKYVAITRAIDELVYVS